jgi:cytochrome c oxidase accessory protein FixG
MGILTVTTYIFAGSMREQICTYLCPWPRIQAALVDAETLQVTYKYDRGEPRGAHKKGDAWEGRGDCVDCNACVAACPMGIDIREGAQLECINCALCIDACDDIMKKVGRPIRLIGYDTDKNIARRAAGERPQVKLVRKRTILYAALLAAVSAIMVWSLSTRATMEINVIRDRTPPYVLLSDGSIRNAYTVKIVNKATIERPLELEVLGHEGLKVSAVGETFEGTRATVLAEGDGVRALRIFVTSPPLESAHPTFPLTISLRDPTTGETASSPTTFLTEKRR